MQSIKGKIQRLPGYNQVVLPWHWLQAAVSSLRYRIPAKKLRVIAVTGTNGKTTTSFMIWKMLNEAGHKTGLLSTVGWSEDGEELHKQFEHMTTERVGVLNRRMKLAAKAGAEFLVLEVTSHALAQYRIMGVPIEVAVFTNLTHDHLDYHKTMAKYRKAKLKLFKKAKNGVVNADDESGEMFAKEVTRERMVSLKISWREYEKVGEVIRYGVEKGDLRATDVELRPDGVEYLCRDLRERKDEEGETEVGKLKIRTQIPGEFNVYNSLATVGVGKLVGLADEEIQDGILALSAVEGRMTRVREGQDFEVIIDYAHAPDALQKVFRSLSFSRTSLSEPAGALSQDAKSSSVRSSTLPRISSKNTALRAKHRADRVENKPRIISVHGGAGQRDHSTRAERGEILGKNSDIVIITEDDSRDEDPKEIAEMFVEGAKRAGKVLGDDLIVELDREKAVKKAIRMAETGDVLLILGKGHEKTILRNDGAHDFEDIKVAQKALRELKKK